MLGIRTTKVTINSVGHTPVRPALLVQIPLDETIRSVVRDSADYSKKCYAAITTRGADAIIPVHRNG